MTGEFRYGIKSLKNICETDLGQDCYKVNPSGEQVHQMIIGATMQSNEVGKDVIVNVGSAHP
jgi:hypothetical protein|tara:strand:- start:202 stop:387 length:186 start_codon:yes stop_codon:yes gene_type:complete